MILLGEGERVVFQAISQQSGFKSLVEQVFRSPSGSFDRLKRKTVFRLYYAFDSIPYRNLHNFFFALKAVPHSVLHTAISLNNITDCIPLIDRLIPLFLLSSLSF